MSRRPREATSRFWVSIVMPVRNEAAFIARSLRSVLDQDYPSDRMEIFVVDGCSEDDTTSKVRAIAGDEKVTVLRNEKRIVSAALNSALEQTRGEVIVRVDGHCEIPSDYVRRCVEGLESSGADNVGGLQRAVGTGMVGRAIAAAMNSAFGMGGARFHFARRSGWVDTVYLGAFRRDVFDRIGSFDEAFHRTQDSELNFRLRRAGGKIWLDPTITVRYHCRPSLRALWRQYHAYGIYKIAMMQKHRAVPAARQLVPPVFVLAVASSIAMMAATRDVRWGVVVLGPYAVANVVASAWAARNDGAALFALPAAFATMHVAWGTGFLRGLWRWRKGFRRRPAGSKGAVRT